MAALGLRCSLLRLSLVAGEQGLLSIALHRLLTAVASLVAQSCLTLGDPMGYRVNGILQARILEWVAFPFTRGSSQHRDRTQVSCIAGRFFTC